ncbi:MAG: YcaO-like family protein [Alphaproteobacteria bacterium]|nr:YcaO-like family protein [Alphaproteobacteria bacterium]
MRVSRGDKLSRLSSFFRQVRFGAPDIAAYCTVLELTDAAFAQWPNFPAAARSAVRPNGRGLDLEQCTRSGVGEAVERASCAEWGDEEVLQASIESVGSSSLSPGLLNGLAPNQIEQRHTWNEALLGLDLVPKSIRDHQTVEWVKVISAHDGGKVFAPADHVFLGRHLQMGDGACSIGDSNGCAAEESEETACIAALLELVERDATGLWWYGGIQGVECPPSVFDLSDDLVGSLSVRERETILISLKAAIGVPVIAAVSADPEGTAIAFGVSASLDANLAATGAILEMYQCELSIHYARKSGAATPLLARWLKTASLESEVLSRISADHGVAQAGSANWTLTDCISHCADAGINLYFRDMTRAEFNVPVWRAISPELCHFKPRFGKTRMLAANPGLSKADPRKLKFLSV